MSLSSGNDIVCRSKQILHNLIKSRETITIIEYKASIWLATFYYLSELWCVCWTLQMAFMSPVLLLILSVTLLTVHLSRLCACAYLLFYQHLCIYLRPLYPPPSCCHFFSKSLQEVFSAFAKHNEDKFEVNWLARLNKGLISFSSFYFLFFFFCTSHSVVMIANNISQF